MSDSETIEIVEITAKNILSIVLYGNKSPTPTPAIATYEKYEAWI